MHPVTVFIERFRAAVSVLIGPCCPANRIRAMCILLYYWANKMMMMMIFDIFHQYSCYCSRLQSITSFVVDVHFIVKLTAIPQLKPEIKLVEFEQIPTF